MTDIRVTQLTTARLTHGLRIAGDPDGVPMLLIHGGFATSRWWEPFLRVLPPELRAVACDLRGVGLSDRPEHGYAVEDHAADMAALVEALGWSEFDLVGHAAGGAVAVEMALNAVGQVRTLCLVDSAPVEGVFTPVEAMMVYDQMRTDTALLDQALRLLMPTLGGEDPAVDAFFAQLVADAQAMAAPAFTGFAASLNNWNRFAEVRQLSLPTLLIWGDQDIVVEREATTRSLIAIPGANRLEVMRGVGHSPMVEAPVALAELIIDFITEDYADFDAVRRAAYDDDQISNI